MNSDICATLQLRTVAYAIRTCHVPDSKEKSVILTNDRHDNDNTCHPFNDSQRTIFLGLSVHVKPYIFSKTSDLHAVI